MGTCVWSALVWLWGHEAGVWGKSNLKCTRKIIPCLSEVFEEEEEEGRREKKMKKSYWREEKAGGERGKKMKEEEE